MKEFAARIGRPKPGKRRDNIRGEKAIPRAQIGRRDTPKPPGAMAKLFGFAIELADHHQVKPNKNGPLID
ncbi:hypothetical protein ACET52_05275 [Aeromonas veronii]